MAATNLALRFIIELIALGAVGYWGFSNRGLGLGRIALGIGASLALIVVWTLVVAPNGAIPLSQPQRDVIGTALLVLAAGALADTGYPTAAVAFGVVVIVNWIGLVTLGPDAIATVAYAAE
jgi:hypothetical protein